MSNIKVKIKSNFTKKEDSNKIYKVVLSRNYDIKIEKAKENKEFNVNIGDKIKHKIDNLIGEVISIEPQRIIVLWNDNCKEKININSFYDEVEIIEVEDIKSEENKVNIDNKVEEDIKDNNIETRKISKAEIKPQEHSELDDLYSNVFSEMEDEYDDIIDANPNRLKEQMLNRKVQSMEKKTEQNKINNIKENAINDLISLMKDKKMIPNESYEKIQKEQLLKMSDSEFETFKKSIVGESVKKENEMTEAEMMLQRIKFGGPVIGGFEKNSGNSSNSLPSGFAAQHESRQLSSVNNKSTTEQIEHTASNNEYESKLNLEGFKNLQGLTKPLQVQNQQKSMKQNLTSAIADLDWTTISKIY